MVGDFFLGCNYNVVPLDVEVSPQRRFEMIRDTGAYDYVNWLPRPDQLADCVAASEKTGLPMLTGNYSHQLGHDDSMLAESMHNASRVGMKIVNVMLHTYAADGHELTDEEIVTAFVRTAEVGDRLGVGLSFELHVDCWTEKYKRITPVAKAIKAKGVPFHLTVDYSHVIFKIENPEQQAISGVQEDVETGRLVLDPYEPGNVLTEWLAQNIVEFAQFRPVVPNNPRNVWAKNPDGSLPRGIMYPFTKPKAGEWHSQWYAYKLEACKEALRTIMRYHLTHATSPLKYIITEMIVQPDYGMNAKFSILEHSAASARWIRAAWSMLKAMHAAGIPLQVTS